MRRSLSLFYDIVSDAVVKGHPSAVPSWSLQSSRLLRPSYITSDFVPDLNHEVGALLI